jgi:hypothetical protein
MIVFSECPYCGLKIGRNSNYCPRCMNHFTNSTDGKNPQFFMINRALRKKISPAGGEEEFPLTYNDEPGGHQCQKITAKSPQMKNYPPFHFLRVKILFAIVMALIIFILIKSSRTGIGIFF